MLLVNQFKTKFIIICCIMISPPVFSQIRSNDVGILLGTSQYNGDVNMTKAYYSPHFTAALYYRQTYNNHYSWRFGLTYGELQGSDSDFDNSYQKTRDYTFADNNLYEFSSVVEYNFFELNYDEKDERFTPFVVGGLGVFYAAELKWHEMFNIPMGFGLKYKIAENLEINADWTIRKTSTDKLDLLDDNSVGYKAHKQFSFTSTNDWYSLVGVTLMINFMSNNSPCGIYDKKNYEYIKKRRR